MTPQYRRRPASGGFAARQAQAGPGSARTHWNRAVSLAAELAGEAEAARGLEAETVSAGGAQILAGRFAELDRALRPLKADNFPLGFASARATAGAFLLLARAFVSRDVMASARSSMAGFLVAGAAALEAHLHALRLEEAPRGRACLGEGED